MNASLLQILPCEGTRLQNLEATSDRIWIMAV